ncbi:MAG: protein-L-isoaspartate O-methyltransferase, partial [Rhodothermales bacterium]|nr:protein-L-isoaspartate O-methyltransferase [Rhodothermales bacterium]
IKCDDGTQGWAAFAPYDAIVVTAGATQIPDALVSQLRLPDDEHRGGRLVIPVGGPYGQTMHRITRAGPTATDEEQFHDFRFVPLIGDH